MATASALSPMTDVLGGVHPTPPPNIMWYASLDDIHIRDTLGEKDGDIGVVGIAPRLNNHKVHWLHALNCGHCGGVPCPVDHEKEKRIRVKDWDFVREVVHEKKILAEQLEKLQRQIEDYRLASEKWAHDKHMMEIEIKRLREINEKMAHEIRQYKKREGKLEMLELRLESILEESERLKAENKRLKDITSKQLSEIIQITTNNKQLESDLNDAKDHIRMLKYQLADTEKALDDMKNDTSKDDMIAELERTVARLHRDIDHYIDIQAEKERMIDYLTGEVNDLRCGLEDCNKHKELLQLEIISLREEIARLRSQLGADKRFKTFVNIKRELTNVKDQNEGLKAIVKSEQTIPVLNPHGKLSLAKVEKPSVKVATRPKTAKR
ncbi:unnamed protein product [Owenia fusiformis]|uniref:Uncharacterized protein n=1 Tax=Owenia fusiformis TaxID=6347 RepID=A0A8S4Q336_OWEFU|nr:unnamed protein product [Owenia fusiformis]